MDFSDFWWTDVFQSVVDVLADALSLMQLCVICSLNKSTQGRADKLCAGESNYSLQEVT